MVNLVDLEIISVNAQLVNHEIISANHGRNICEKEMKIQEIMLSYWKLEETDVVRLRLKIEISFCWISRINRAT